jgi:transketolase
MVDRPGARVRAQAIRRIILEQSRRAQVGHIGCALSVADIMAALFGGALEVTRPEDPARDRFVLSKGHAALALYAALHLRGWLSRERLDSFCGDGSMLGVHPEHILRGVDFATGSLGHGLSMAAGAALAARLQSSTRRVFALISDAECNEGSVWEAIMFAAHHRLSNLIVILDLNGQQAFGFTREVLSLDPLAARMRASGWDTHEVDGHDEAKVREVIERLDTSHGAPHMLVARTVFGKGVSYMEGRIKWHYLPMTEGEYEQALREVEARE